MTNCYVLETGEESLVVDPAADPGTLLCALSGTSLRSIILTHGHDDHRGALSELVKVTGVSVWMHSEDRGLLATLPFTPLQHGQSMQFGSSRTRIVHLPGHRAGSIALDLGDRRLLVGDSIFPGGPGRTDSPAALVALIPSLRDRVFVLADDTQLFPGHGASTTVGQERSAFDAFLSQEWPAALCGDVRWDSVATTAAPSVHASAVRPSPPC